MPTDAEEEQRTIDELNRTKFGDSLTRYDPPLDLEVVFRVAGRMLTSLVGYEFTDAGGRKILVGHANEYGAISEGSPRASGHTVAGRKVWFG